MKNLSDFLKTESSSFGAKLGDTGGYIEFSNSGKRGGTKSFHISLEALNDTLKDIRRNINKFEKMQTYEEKPWRDCGAEYFTNSVANATITVQTKPLFSTLSKLIKWANPQEYAGFNTDTNIVITEETLDTTISRLDDVISLYEPRKISPPFTRPIQKIFFGAPGSGKSYKVQEEIGKKRVHRTTFHPDSDYASFVGCYKPVSRKTIEKIYSYEELLNKTEEVKDEKYASIKFFAKYAESLNKLSPEEQKQIRNKIAGKSIKGDVERNAGINLGLFMQDLLNTNNNNNIYYEFVPQVFTEAYIDAWTHPTEDVCLVIEEINRGNCAQIFGDLFQLLDRDKNGYSSYKIKADSDLKDYLYNNLNKENEGIKNGELRFPPNLHIFATMNTSDQSLFPMDSAFKRRWDWEYVPIDYSSSEFIISLGNNKYKWIDFLQKVNEKIREVTDSEDKQMGNFFIKGDVDENEFKSKVMFYVWNEVCRDEYGTNNNFFRYITDNGEEKQFSFNDLYIKDPDPSYKLNGFMTLLGVEPLQNTQGTNN